jgi:hypothetical protein
MSIEAKTAILEKKVTYSGDGISVAALEETIESERSRQDVHVEELMSLRQRNAELQSALGEEMAKLRQLSDHLSRERNRGGLWSSMREMLAKLPGFKDRIITRHSIEDLLRRQYELSAQRLKEAAEFADRLGVAKQDLYDEIARLNRKIIESADNEERAAARVIELSELKSTLEIEVEVAEEGSLEGRKLQAKLDETRRALAEHSMHLKLYSTTEERLAKLRKNTRQLAETIGNLQTDITRYVTAASDKLDTVSGQIQAIGAAADASVVMLELKHSLEAMTESINETTRFVSETQTYFRENVDDMVEDLEIYDEQTEHVLERNLAASDFHDEMQIEEAVTLALSHKIEEAAAEAGVRDEDLEGGARADEEVARQVEASEER